MMIRQVLGLAVLALALGLAACGGDDKGASSGDTTPTGGDTTGGGDTVGDTTGGGAAGGDMADAGATDPQ